MDLRHYVINIHKLAWLRAQVTKCAVNNSREQLLSCSVNAVQRFCYPKCRMDTGILNNRLVLVRFLCS